MVELKVRPLLARWGRHRGLIAVALLSLVTLAAVTYVVWLESVYTNAFDLMVVGNSEADMRRLAGSPSYMTDGTRWVEPQYPKDQAQLVKGCVKELWYENPWRLPQKYSYCFDTSGTLVHKYNWASW